MQERKFNSFRELLRLPLMDLAKQKLSTSSGEQTASFAIGWVFFLGANHGQVAHLRLSWDGLLFLGHIKVKWSTVLRWREWATML